MNLNFDWDEEKAAAHLKKHKVSFDEAATVFKDPFSITISDPDHSVHEHRYIDIGSSDKGNILVVVYYGARCKYSNYHLSQSHKDGTETL